MAIGEPVEVVVVKQIFLVWAPVRRQKNVHGMDEIDDDTNAALRLVLPGLLVIFRLSETFCVIFCLGVCVAVALTEVRAVRSRRATTVAPPNPTIIIPVDPVVLGTCLASAVNTGWGGDDAGWARVGGHQSG